MTTAGEGTSAPDGPELLGEFAVGVEFGLIHIRDAADGGRAPFASDWDPTRCPVLAGPQQLLVAVRHYVDGPVRCQVWGAGVRAHRLPHVLHTGSLSVTSGSLLVGDVDEDIVLRVKPDAAVVEVTVRADRRAHASQLEVELSDV